MVRKFSQNASRPIRAYQIWLILIAKAHNRQTVTYKVIADMLGYEGAGTLGKTLDLIWYYCKVNELPPLTGIVVNQVTGQPGEGMGNYDLSEQEAVFRFDWYDIVPPTPEELQETHQSK